MKYRKTLYNHKLATQPLRDVVALAGPAITPEEMQILVSVVGSYKRMRGAFPTEQLRTDLDALYTKAFKTAFDTVVALSSLTTDYGWLAIEGKELSKEEILGAVFEASNELTPEVAQVLNRCHQLLFLAFGAAANRINAALKAAKKK